MREVIYGLRDTAGDMTGAHRRQALVVCCLVLAVLAVPAPVTAASDTVDVRNPASGETTTHTWNVTVSSGGNGTLEYLIVNYTGTGGDLSSAGIDDSAIVVNETTVGVSVVSQSTGRV
ncbi:MAG: hypothetical protein ABEJ97_08505, partial [Halobellus sp.]